MPKKTTPKRLSRDEKRNLDVEIAFIEGVVRRDPAYVEALQILGDDYTRRGRIDDGLKVDQQLAQLLPDDPSVLYNLACSYSLTNDAEAALCALDRALSAGYSDFKWLATDPDLENVRKHPAFDSVRAKIKNLKTRGGGA
jgi:tetratricopeptide (TPR) repeat protein